MCNAAKVEHLTGPVQQAPQPMSFHLAAKPIGPRRNLDCSYRFYLERKPFFPDRHQFRI